MWRRRTHNYDFEFQIYIFRIGAYEISTEVCEYHTLTKKILLLFFN